MIPDGHWLATERLALRRMTADDAEWLLALYSDPAVAEHLGGVRTRAQVDEMMDERVLRYYDQHPGLGIWMTTERGTGQGVGFHLINHIHGESILQIGYALLTPAWGKGYATEMCLALLHYAFTRLDLPQLSGMTTPGNAASIRVLQKIGLERRGERRFSHPSYAKAGPLAWFEIERDAWLERHAGLADHYDLSAAD